MQKFSDFTANQQIIEGLDYLREEERQNLELFDLFVELWNKSFPRPQEYTKSQPPPLPQKQKLDYKAVASEIEGSLGKLLKDRNLQSLLQNAQGGNQVVQNLVNSWNQFKQTANSANQQQSPQQNQKQPPPLPQKQPNQQVDPNKNPQGYIKQLLNMSPEDILGNDPNNRENKGMEVMNFLRKYQNAYPDETTAAMNKVGRLLYQ